MKDLEKIEYIKYRIESAYQTFNAAEILAKNGYWNSAVNRLYYSLFYAVNALLVLKGINIKSHSSTKSQFSLHFIKTGTLDKKYGQLFSELFDWRQKGDYENFFNFTEEAVSPLFKPVEEMIESIDKLIKNAL